MPQIETLMLIGLGFCLAAVITVAAVKVAWKLAVQTSERRAQRGSADLKPAGELDDEALKAEYTKLRRRYELKVEDYNTQLAEQLAELSRTRKQIEDIKAGHTKACQQHEARKGKVADLKQTISDLQAKAVERDERIETLEENTSEAEKSAKEQAESIAALRQELDAANARISELKAQAAKDRSEIAGLTETETAITQDLADKTSRVAELEMAATNHESAIGAGKSKIASLADELSHARRDNEKLHKTVHQLTDDLTARTRALEEAKTEIEQIAEDKSETDGQLRKLVGTENERLGTLNRLEQELKHRDDDLARANRELGELHSAKATVEQDRDTARQAIQSRDSTIKLLKTDIADAKSDLEARDAIVIMLRKQVASHEASLSALNEEMTALRRRADAEAVPSHSDDTGNGVEADLATAGKKVLPAAAVAASAENDARPLASRIRSLQQIIVNP